jgi:hypothetical protein
MQKASRGNYFSVLDDDESPSVFQLAPSSLSSLGGISASKNEESRHLPNFYEQSNDQSGSNSNNIDSGWKSTVDLSSITNSIINAESRLPMSSAESAWDFSGLATSAEEEKKRDEELMQNRKRVFEATLAARHASDRMFITEKLQKSVRKRVEAGMNFDGKLSTKLAKRLESQKRRNSVKHK